MVDTSCKTKTIETAENKEMWSHENSWNESLVLGIRSAATTRYNNN